MVSSQEIKRVKETEYSKFHGLEWQTIKSRITPAFIIMWIKNCRLIDFIYFFSTLIRVRFFTFDALHSNLQDAQALNWNETWTLEKLNWNQGDYFRKKKDVFINV